MMAFTLAPQRCAADAESRGGILERRCHREHAPDVLLLDLRERRLLKQGSVARSTGLKKDLRQILLEYRLTTAQHDRTFDSIAQFADVARP
jgi:hypothetical protein